MHLPCFNTELHSSFKVRTKKGMHTIYIVKYPVQYVSALSVALTQTQSWQTAAAFHNCM